MQPFKFKFQKFPDQLYQNLVYIILILGYQVQEKQKETIKSLELNK